MNEKENLRKDLKKCDCDSENRLQNIYPFFFEIKEQKIMLISYVPGFQAAYRQLSSVRFFRVLYLSLFGWVLPHNNKTMVSLFMNNIYWTHYHKCYIPRTRAEREGERIPSIVPDICFKKHMKKEIRLCNPKIIIILGKAAEKIINDDLTDKMDSKKYFEKVVKGKKIICAVFPKTGTEPVFQKIREIIKPYINEVNTEIVSKEKTIKNYKEKDTFKIHTNFELQALKNFWSLTKKNKKSPREITNIDDAFINIDVQERWINYSFIVGCFNFIEDQLTGLCYEKDILYDKYISHRSNDCIVKKIKTVFGAFGENVFLNKEAFEQDLDDFRIIRNRIVHCGGRIDPINNRRDKKEKLVIARNSNIFMQASGVLEITDDYCESVLSLTEKLVAEINKINTER